MSRHAPTDRGHLRPMVGTALRAFAHPTSAALGPGNEVSVLRTIMMFASGNSSAFIRLVPIELETLRERPL